jgi:hypothetical protein
MKAHMEEAIKMGAKMVFEIDMVMLRNFCSNFENDTIRVETGVI